MTEASPSRKTEPQKILTFAREDDRRKKARDKAISHGLLFICVAKVKAPRL
jgi:hypothetical protein